MRPRRPRRTGSAVHISRTEEEPVQAVVHISRTEKEPLQAVFRDLNEILNLLNPCNQSTQSI